MPRNSASGFSWFPVDPMIAVQNCPKRKQTRSATLIAGGECRAAASIAARNIEPMLFNFHLCSQNFFIGPRFPNNVARHAIIFRQSVQRHERHVFHQDSPGLLQNRDALFGIAGFLFFVD